MSLTQEDEMFMDGNDGTDVGEQGDYWDECSLCDSGVDCMRINSERMPLPGRESLTADMDVFLNYVHQIRKSPRRMCDTPFNERFWLFVKTVLETAVPIGYCDLPNRYLAAPKGLADNNALIKKFSDISPLNPIYPNLVAVLSGVSLHEVLTELLYATFSGMCTMRFTPSCERCGSPTCANLSLVSEEKLPVMAFCRSCRFSNPIDCLEKVKIVFVLNSDVLYVLAENFSCKPSKESMRYTELYAMVPCTFSGSGFRFSIGCDGDLMLRPAMPAGKYRMHCTVSSTDGFLVVERDATEDDEPCLVKLHVSDLVFSRGNRKVVVVPHGKFRIEVFCDTNSFFILWAQQNVEDHKLLYVPPEERIVSCSALLVMAHPTYKTFYERTEKESEHVASAVAQMVSQY